MAFSFLEDVCIGRTWTSCRGLDERLRQRGNDSTKSCGRFGAPTVVLRGNRRSSSSSRLRASRNSAGSCIATDASATCKFKAKKDIIVILDVGHTDKDSGQISARGVKEYDFNMNLARRVLEELVNTGFLSTQMIVTSGSNTHESRLQRSKRANDLDADLFISIHHDGVKNETRMPWQYNGKEHWFLD